MSSYRLSCQAARSVRAIRARGYATGQVQTPAVKGNGASHALIGGLAGGTAVALGGYAYYHYSGASTLVSTARKSEQLIKSYAQQFKTSGTDFEPNQAIDWLKSTSKSYAAFIPGASGFLDSAFNDIDAVRRKHGPEVDSILKEAYTELKDISNKEGLSLTTAQKSWEVLQQHLKRIADLAGDAGQDIINNHPQLKAKVGGSIDQLKDMGKKYGPEAQKQVEDTTNQIKDILKGGIGAGTIAKVQKLVEEKVQKMQELGEKVWEQGMEKAKPLLEKSPQVKELVEENTDALKKSGNVQELYQKIKDAVSSKNVDSLKEYVDKIKQGARDGAKNGGGLEEYLKAVPGGGQIFSKLSQIRQLAQEHGEEAEKIAKDAFTEVEEVLQRKAKEAQDLAKKAK